MAGKNFSCCDYAVISIDMLVYGGIVPSRLHHQTTRECLDRLHLLADLRARYPQVKLFAFSLIMRAPCYNSADEEPDYYAEHGSSLFRVGVLRDKIQRNLATAEENPSFPAWNRAFRAPSSPISAAGAAPTTR